MEKEINEERDGNIEEVMVRKGEKIEEKDLIIV